MAEMAADLRRACREHPDQPFDLIIRVSGDLAQRSEALAKRGVQVRRKLRLTSALGVRCSGSTALKLARSPWVTRIEADGPVRALGR